MIWIPVALLEVLICGVFWIAGAIIGIPMTLAACLSKAYEYEPDAGDLRRGRWVYTWPIMRYWSTWDNGAAPVWYVHDNANRPLWFNLWVFSGWRNAFGGNPLNLVVRPELIKWKSDSGSPVRLAVRMVQDKARNECKWMYWNVTRYQWRVGFHFLFPFHRKPGSKHSHFEIRHGWKLYPDAPGPTMMVFSFWDTGPRFR